MKKFAKNIVFIMVFGQNIKLELQFPLLFRQDNSPFYPLKTKSSHKVLPFRPNKAQTSSKFKTKTIATVFCSM